MKTIVYFLLFGSLLFASNFERNETDQTVTDKTRHIIWQDQKFNATQKMSFKNAISYCSTLKFGQLSSWRLPSGSELSSLIDDSRTPTIDINFKHAADGAYWADSNDHSSKGLIWIDFSSGEMNKGSGVDRYLFIRCVHDKR